jgi:hypothetical protein
MDTREKTGERLQSPIHPENRSFLPAFGRNFLEKSDVSEKDSPSDRWAFYKLA